MGGRNEKSGGRREKKERRTERRGWEKRERGQEKRKSDGRREMKHFFVDVFVFSLTFSLLDGKYRLSFIIVALGDNHVMLGFNIYSRTLKRLTTILEPDPRTSKRLTHCPGTRQARTLYSYTIPDNIILKSIKT